MKQADRIKTNDISPNLTCRYSFAPGFDWSAELTFKPLKRGFAVTGQLAEDEEAGVRRIVGKSAELLTWRSACAWLEQHEEAGLAGDVLCDIKHDAEVPWQGEPVAWTWICHDRPDGLLYDLLMRSSDELLGRLWQSGGSFVHGQGSFDLVAFAEACDELACDELDWLDVSSDEIVARLGGRIADVSPSWLRQEAERRLNP